MMSGHHLPPQAKLGEVSPSCGDGGVMNQMKKHDPSGPADHLPTLARGEEEKRA